MIYRKPNQPDFKAHGWSIRSVAAQLYQEQLRRGEKATLEKAMLLVEQHTCSELMKLADWSDFIEITSEWRSEDYLPIDAYDRELSSPSSQGQLFAVVFPFCAKDGNLALKLMKWIVELTPPNDHLLVVSHDYQTPPHIVSSIQDAAKGCFRSIKTLTYSVPSLDQWPPTMAFKAAALYMEKVGTPWLWMEYDAVPLVPHWLDKLQDVYWKCGKAFAGPIVPDLGHMNGTGVYPANTPNRIPRALGLTRTAWDITCKAEMIHDCFDLSPTYQHAWTMGGGRLHPYAGGEPPSFPPGSPMVKQIHPQAVVFHRNKDLSLVDRLRERKLQPA